MFLKKLMKDQEIYQGVFDFEFVKQCYYQNVKVISWVCLIKSMLSSFTVGKSSYWFYTINYLIHLQKYQHRGLRKIKMYQLQTILHSMIDHELDCWHKPKKKRGPKMNHDGTLALTLVHEEMFSFKLYRCFLSSKKSDKILSSLLKVSFYFSLNLALLRQTLWNAFETSRNIVLTSNPSPKYQLVLHIWT